MFPSLKCRYTYCVIFEGVNLWLTQLCLEFHLPHYGYSFWLACHLSLAYFSTFLCHWYLNFHYQFQWNILSFTKRWLYLYLPTLYIHITHTYTFNQDKNSRTDEKEILSNWRSWNFSYFLLKTLLLFFLPFKSKSLLELIFVYGVKWESQFVFLHVVIHCPRPFIVQTIFFSVNFTLK